MDDPTTSRRQPSDRSRANRPHAESLSERATKTDPACPVQPGQRLKHPSLGWITVRRIDGLRDVLALVGHELRMVPYWDVVVRRDGRLRNERINVHPVVAKPTPKAHEERNGATAARGPARTPPAPRRP